MYKPANIIKLTMSTGKEILVPTDKTVQDIEKEIKDYNVLVFGKQVIQCNEVKKVDLYVPKTKVK